MMKKFAKAVVAKILGWQVRRLREKNTFTVVAIAGSIGKTSTKLAIAQLLGSSQKVQYQDGNYNDIISVPLIFFGMRMPSLLNPLSWVKLILRIEKQLKRPYPYDIVVVELATDGPGQIAQFQQYLKADIGVLTAITPEHMEYFEDLDGVAKEELSISLISNKILYSSDLIDQKYQQALPSSSISYALKAKAVYQLSDVHRSKQKYSFNILYDRVPIIKSDFPASSEIQLYAVCAAVAVAHQLGFELEKISSGLKAIMPVPGRMNRLAGIQGSTIIDDTYNASPVAVRAALDAIYNITAPQKIAILGNMNELGKYSADEHRKIGAYCNPKELALVVTIGADANKHLALAAEERGCRVMRYKDPFTAGTELREMIKPGAVILAKGSQNGVFAEETVKLLLANPKDSTKLVRQSDYWLRLKHKQMGL